MKETIFNTYTFSNHDINKFISLLQKGGYPYEYLNDREKFSETSLPKEEDFYSHLNMEDITNADCKHKKRVWKDFEIEILGEHRDSYAQSDTLLLADIFDNF